MRETSRTAYDSVQPRLKALQQTVYDRIRRAPATSDELEAEMDMKHQTLSARVWELHTGGWVVDSGKRRPTRSGRAAIVWRAV